MAMKHHCPSIILSASIFLHLTIYVSGDNIAFPSRLVNPSTVGEIWPKPQKQELRNEYVGIIEPFSFKVIGKSCDILENALKRYEEIFKTNWRKYTKFDEIVTAPIISGKTTKLKINLTNDCEKYPHINMSEKYRLEIRESSCLLTSKSIWGILRGLESFSQLPIPAPDGQQLLLQVQKIEDYPRYPHRGLLIDTSRHYLPVATIKKQLDIMSYNKLNVLHWHIVDDQSFPYQSKKFPLLSQKGAFDPESAIYSEAMIKSIVEHARLRGIRVIAEFDTPGHTDGMEAAYPEIHCHCPYPDNRESKFVGPMDPTKNRTMDFVKELFSEVGAAFPENYLHVGGDEVDSYCWENNPEIKQFMNSNHWSGRQLQSYYMQNVLNIMKDLSKKSIVWEEVFMNWENLNGTINGTKKMDVDTIVQVWRGSQLHEAASAVQKVASEGFKVITSIGWYLDNLQNTFADFHNIDLNNMSLTADQKKLLLGGEACMWGEHVDETNIEPRVWPRACATAENLWSRQQANETDVMKRITEHVCRMKRRNVAAESATDISYCNPVIERPNSGHPSLSRYFNTFKETLGFGDDDDEPDAGTKYDTVLPTSTTAAPSVKVNSTANGSENEGNVEKSSASLNSVTLALLYLCVAHVFKQ